MITPIMPLLTVVEHDYTNLAPLNWWNLITPILPLLTVVEPDYTNRAPLNSGGT
jgi:hypothetical protein